MSFNKTLLKQLFPMYSPQAHIPVLIKGLTNQNLLFDIDGRKVLYKILNQDFSQFIDRKHERDIMYKVPKHPKIYYADDATIVREFLDVHEPLSVDRFNAGVIDRFAKELYGLHNTPCDTKRGKIQDIMASPDFFKETREFLRKHSGLVAHADMELYLAILDRFESDRSTFNDILRNDKDRVVNCHNDLNMENIMLDEQTDELVLIDYDYAQPNVLYYDFGNLFTEMNFEYTKEPPFFEYKPDNNAMKLKKQMIIDCYAEQAGLPNVDAFMKKCEQYKIFSHLFWINVSFKSLHLGIDLAIPEYVRKRFELYNNEFEEHFI